MKNTVRVLAGFTLYAISIVVLQTGLLGGFILDSVVDLVWRYRIAGSITLRELKQLRGGKRSDVADITKITGRFWRNVFTPDNVILEVHTANQSMVISAAEREIPNLIRAGFCNWVIMPTFLAKNLFTVCPCESGAPKRIEYNAVGRYAFSPDMIGAAFVFFVLGASVIYSIGLIDVWGLLILLFIPYLFLFPSYIAKRRVTLDEKGITMKDADGTQFIPYSEVTAVEKGVHRVKITTRSSKQHHFPKACFLLAELVQLLGDMDRITAKTPHDS